MLRSARSSVSLSDFCCDSSPSICNFLPSYVNIVKITTVDISSSCLTSGEITPYAGATFLPFNASPAGIFQGKSFVLFKGKYRWCILSALIALCSSGFSYSNDASFSLQP